MIKNKHELCECCTHRRKKWIKYNLYLTATALITFSYMYLLVMFEKLGIYYSMGLIPLFYLGCVHLGFKMDKYLSEIKVNMR